MRIAQISTLSAPVRRDSGGSVEGLVWLLTRELARLGHEVTVFGASGSEVEGEVVATLPGPYGAAGSFDDWQLCEWVNLCQAVEQSHRFDVLHTHAYLWGLPLEPFSRAPMAHTLHIVPDENAARLRRKWPDAPVVSVSNHQWSAFPDLTPATVIHHGVDTTQFEFRAEPEDYVCYLGRFTSGKGPLHAIHAARALGIRLVLAGPENAYYREQIKPHVDGCTIEYAGFVRGSERSRLLGGAKALLYPIQFAEAFGLVLVEAMLCGTPVAAIGLGAVPEIVDEGVTGCIAKSMEDFPRIIPKCFALDRATVRRQAVTRFSAERMAQAHAQFYERITKGVNA
jgi:glycosyltransferase involved in cell wall biosynthesis